ncbi:MAG: polysaccharide pyruvyl transferase family protein [Mariniphaga sp.]|nr:polysaccharide pyruvyl transferase family protein [Mariniphaga sp.]
MKPYYIISGLELNDNNRGTAALGYGAFFFLHKFHGTIDLTPIRIFIYIRPWKLRFRKPKKETLNVGNKAVVLRNFYISFFDYWIFKNAPFLSKLTKTARILKKVSFAAAINGGDGFSDIYGTEAFEHRLFITRLALKKKIPLIILPQTLGPFKDNSNLETAKAILKYASKIYVRDDKFISTLSSWQIPFELTKDLSYYMKPEKVDIETKPGAIGLNISGLCYSNEFKDLSGQFDLYPSLIFRIINYFQKKNKHIYLISHSYNYDNPEISNDDLQATRDVYNKLKDKTNVQLIDRNLNAPQTKYIISRCDFFIGTRMHACFAAIFTKTPLFGLAYSYKYEGSFRYMGLENNYTSILNIKEDQIDDVISKIDDKYVEYLKNN